MYAISTTCKTRSAHRSIYNWAKALDKEIKDLRESREKVTNRLRWSRLAGTAKYHTEELEDVLTRTAAYYDHLIEDRQKQARLAFQRHENRQYHPSCDGLNLYADLIAEFKGFKNFMGDALGDYIITIVPGWASGFDMMVTDETLRRNQSRVERRGIGMIAVRKSGRLYVHYKLNWK